MSGKSPVICIGGANVDRKLYAKHEIMEETSNPVKSSRTVGGVARNIAENLGRLGEPVAFLSVRGEDSDWLEIANISSPFMDLTYVAEIKDAATGSYTAVLDKSGDLSIALADMDIFDEITPALLEKNNALLKTAKCIIVDLNCPKETIEYLCSFTSQHEIPLVIIPVSSPKMDRLPKSLERVKWLIVNKDETETFLDLKINDQQDWEDAVRKWLLLGVQNVIVTNGSEGVIVGSEGSEIKHFEAIHTPNVTDVTGAGDSFCSGVVYAWLKAQSLDKIIQSGLVNSHKTILSQHTVRQDLSPKQFKLDMEEIYL